MEIRHSVLHLITRYRQSLTFHVEYIKFYYEKDYLNTNYMPLPYPC